MLLAAVPAARLACWSQGCCCCCLCCELSCKLHVLQVSRTRHDMMSGRLSPSKRTSTTGPITCRDTSKTRHKAQDMGKRVAEPRHSGSEPQSSRKQPIGAWMLCQPTPRLLLPPTLGENKYAKFLNAVSCFDLLLKHARGPDQPLPSAATGLPATAVHPTGAAERIMTRIA